MNTAVLSRNSGRAATRGGVVLLIMLGMLALFTLIAATFVISAGHFRRGATSASRAEQMGDPFEVLLQQALMQVVRGSNNPQSVIGPHSLLEDLYGEADSVAGMVVETTMTGLNMSGFPGAPNVGAAQAGTRASFYPTSVSNIPFGTPNARPQDFTPMLLEFAAVGFGWDKQPGIALVDDDNNGIVDDISEAFAGDDAVLGSRYAHPVTCGVPAGEASAAAWESKQANGRPLPIIDNVDNHYAGRVITFLSGPAAGKSTHIVRSKAVPLDAETGASVNMLWVQPPFGDVRPTTRDRFIINGRPFNGTGFGYSPYVDNSTGNFTPKTRVADMRRLDMRYFNPVQENVNKDTLIGVPIALLPNPTDAGYREYLQAAAPLVDADEEYDAADVQNMLLAHRIWNPSRGRYETVMPSLHRPDLVNYFVRNYGHRDWTQLSPIVRRRLILRPEAADHYDYTQENKIDPKDSDGWTPAESFTDANRNGQWDPGEPFQDRNSNNAYDTGDRTFAANAFDAVNGPWDVDNDGDGEADSIWVDLGLPVTTLADGRAVKPLFAILCTDLDGRLNMNAHGSQGHYMTNADLNDPEFNPLGPTARGSTDERVLVGAGGYLNVQENLNGQYSFTPVPTKYPLDGIQLNLLNLGETAESAYATKYLFDEPARRTNSSQMFEPALGQGESVADVNLGAFFLRHEEDFATLPINRNNTLQVHNRNNRYRWLLEGTYFPNVYSNFALTSAHMLGVGMGGTIPLVGRYGEAHLMRPLNNPPHYPGTGIRPRAGLSAGSSSMGIVVPGARMGDPADDDWAGAPSPVRNGGGPANTNLSNMVVRGNNVYSSLVAPGGGLNMNAGVYATPPDPDGNGFVGLDIAGRPIYKNMGLPGETQDEPWEINIVRRYSPRARSTTSVGDIDANFTPGELARLLRDADLDASMYEPRLAQFLGHDYNPRSNPLMHGVTTEQWDIPCPHIAPTPEMSAALQALGLPVNNPSLGDLLRARFYLAYGGNINAVTAARLATISMRSYRMAIGTGTSATGPDVDFVDGSGAGTVPGGWRVHFSPTQSATCRMTTMGLKRRNTRLMSPDLVVGLRMNVNAPLGNSYDDDGDGVVDEWTEAIEVKELASLTNNFSSPGQPLWSAQADSPPPAAVSSGFFIFANGGLRCDTNRDGNYDNRIDEMGHQQQAKELYCLMMLLLDQNYAIPALEMTTNATATPAAPGVPARIGVGTEEVPPAITATLPANTPPNSRMRSVKAWLTARQIAQWAINAVDFRDRDTIMTPFEFDVDPFFDNDEDCTLSNLTVERPRCNGTWDVDGLVADDPSESVPDSTKPWRGLVWGCEYPDLILTETLAFHDRRTQNMELDTTPTDPVMRTTGFTLANYQGSIIATTGDPNWDQVRMPQGSLFVELYATGNPHLSLSSNSGSVESALPRELYTVDGRLNLSKVVSGTRWVGTTSSAACNPVWRLAITAGAPVDQTLHPNNVAQRGARHPSTCSFNPLESYGSLNTSGPTAMRPNFSILPPSLVGNSGVDLEQVTINRIVAFTPERMAVQLRRVPAPTPGAVITMTLDVNASPEPVFNDPAVPGYVRPDVYRHFDRTVGSPAQKPILAYPGDYVVVGPHRPAITPTTNAPPIPLDNVTSIGWSVSTTTGGGVTTLASLTTGGVPTLTYLQGLNEASVALETPYNRPAPIIDLGINPQMPVSMSMPVAISDETRPFVVTNLSGADEHPVAPLHPATGTVVVRQPSLLTQAQQPGQAIISSTLVTRPSATFATMTDNPSYALVRRPVVVPTAITDTNTTDVANFGQPVGLNISEPQVLVATTGNRHGLQYKNLGSPISSANTVNPFDPRLVTRDTWVTSATDRGPYSDLPFDGYGIATSATYREPDAGSMNPEFQQMGITKLHDETYLNVKTVFLQRLADPTRVWDNDTNPYITLDWMPIDLTLFNGQSQRFDSAKSKAFHLMDPDNPPTRQQGASVTANDTTALPGPGRVRFGSRQRGSPSRPFKGRNSSFDLWSQPNWLDVDAETMSDWYAGPPPTKSASGDATVRTRYNLAYGMTWQHPLQHTLGYLNVGYHVNRTLTSLSTKPTLTNAVRTPFVRVPGSRPNPQQIGGGQSGDSGWYTGWDLCADRNSPALAMYVGAPRRPFNWLAWNNRPYASAMELMIVPCSGPSRLLHDFDMRRTAVGPISNAAVPNPPASPQIYPDERRRSANEYLPYLVGGGSNKFGYTQAPPFKYLLNFFTSSVSAPALRGVDPTVLSDVQPNYYRVFEFLTVPSKFAGTQQMHLHGRYTTSGGFLGVWNNAMRIRNPNNPETDFLIASTPPGASNPGTPVLPAAEYEHPGWPFTAPNNYISIYREPGRVNVNTIPILSPSRTYNAPRGGDKRHDYGATIWRGVINEFFPALHPLGTGNEVTAKHVFGANQNWRAWDAASASNPQNTFITTGVSGDWESPSDDYIDNFFGMFAGMRSDWPRFDFRGPNAAWQGGGDDRATLLNDGQTPPIANRRDYTAAGRIDPQKPAWIANPIRSFMADYSATPPQIAFSTPYISPLAQNHESAYQTVPYLAVDATLLRRKDTTWSPWQARTNNPDGSVSWNPIPHNPQTSLHIDPAFDPLFALNFPRPGTSAVSAYTLPMFDQERGKIADYRNSDRNPFFRYQLYTKLGSVVTTRSNVYSIWITVGMFECERVSSEVPDILPSQTGMGKGNDFAMAQRFPDGFRILRELGVDTGETRRHKIFAIFDRSIPVGFKRGENYNVDQAFLLRHIVD